MRRLVAVAMLLALALVLAAPAAPSASGRPKVKFSGWELYRNGKVTHVKPGGTYVHCPGTHPRRIVVRGHLSNPSTAKQAVDVHFQVAHHVIFRYHGLTGREGRLAGKIHGGGGPLPDGDWQAFAIRGGVQVGHTRLTVLGRPSACG